MKLSVVGEERQLGRKNRSMEFNVFEAEHNGIKCIIEEDLPEVGVYLYSYENGKCIRDDLQNTIKDCMEIANEYFQIPLNSWEQKESKHSKSR